MRGLLGFNSVVTGLRAEFLWTYNPVINWIQQNPNPIPNLNGSHHPNNRHISEYHLENGSLSPLKFQHRGESCAFSGSSSFLSLSLSSDLIRLQRTQLQFVTLLTFEDMHPGGYTVEVTGLSPKATEKDVYDFFAFSGAIEHVEIVRSGEYACTAYVTFRDAYAQGTAVLLSGATILDQRVCITSWGQYEDEFDLWNRRSPNLNDETGSIPPQHSVSNVGEAVTVAQEVVKTMLTKGYVLGKDSLGKAKAFDESHQVSATAAAKVAELSQRIGLADKICAGVEAVNSFDEKYHVSETTRSAVSAAANAVVNSSYFSKGADWMSGALTRAAKVAADLGSRNVQQ